MLLASCFIDDLIYVGLKFDECVENIIASKSFWIHWDFRHTDKYIFLPNKATALLRFTINSKNMEITFTNAKKETLKACCNELLNETTQTIRYVARVIGLITSSLPGVKYTAAHYKYLKQDKTNSLKESLNALMF